MCRLLPKIRFTIARVPIIEVNIEVKIPSDRVIAKPLIGPVPKANRTTAAIKVVIFASDIDDKALSYPELILPWAVPPDRNSSLIRSKIRTLASTAIPTVRTIPAIPGRVSEACNRDNNATIKIKFVNKERIG